MKKIPSIFFCISLFSSFFINTSQDQYGSSNDTVIDHLFNEIPTQTSYDESDDRSNLDTEEITQENNSQSSYTLTNLKEVSVNISILNQLHQIFTHSSHVYKEINYNDFYEYYPQIVNAAIDKAMKKSKLSTNQQIDVESYTIIGEQPLDNEDTLYDCKKSLKYLQQEINQYIDTNEASIRSLCIGYVLQQARSKDVWAPGCCDIQLHKDCFKGCKEKQLHKCINLFCKNSKWSTTFYKDVCKKRPHVPNLKIYDSDCPLCLEPLIVDEHIKNAQKRNNQAIHTSSDGSIQEHVRKKSKTT